MIHPITLDAIFQTAYTALSTEAQATIGTAVPKSVRSLFVSADIDTSPGAELVASTCLLHYHRQGFDVSLAAQP